MEARKVFNAKLIDCFITLYFGMIQKGKVGKVNIWLLIGF